MITLVSGGIPEPQSAPVAGAAGEHRVPPDFPDDSTQPTYPASIVDPGACSEAVVPIVICPLLQTGCLGVDCMWYFKQKGQCAVVAIPEIQECTLTALGILEAMVREVLR